MAKAMGPFRDSLAPSWLSRPRPGLPLIGPGYNSFHVAVCKPPRYTRIIRVDD